MWNLAIRTIVYNIYAIFRYFESTSKDEEVKREKELEKLESDLRIESHGLKRLTGLEEEVEVQILDVRIFG